MTSSTPKRFDIVFLGNYTKDTIVSAAGTRIVDGGAFNYGAHVAAVMQLKVAAITRECPLGPSCGTRRIDGVGGLLRRRKAKRDCLLCVFLNAGLQS